MKKEIFVKTVGVNENKIRELNKEFIDTSFIVEPLNNILEVNKIRDSDRNFILIVSGEDLNLDLFKENLKLAEKYEKSVVALLPLKDMDLLISTFSRPFFDFCLPPHESNEILLRILNLTGKANSEENSVLSMGPLTINQESYEVKLEGTKIILTFKEYELLRYLAQKPGRVFSREAILHSVWEYDYYGGTRTVDVHIRRLRSKINDIRYNFIETVWNVGYRFKATQT